VSNAWVEVARPRVTADAARSAALFYFVGALIVGLQATVVPSPSFSNHWLPWLFVGWFAAVGATLRLIPARLPVLAWPCVVGLPVVVILVMSILSRDATATSQLSLCFPVLFAAYHLRPVMARLVALEAVIAEVTLVVLIDPSRYVVEDAVGVSAILIAVMLTLVRARDHLDAGMRTLRHDAEHDALTGLLSRRTFDADLELLDDDQPVSLILVDIDDFKSVNDTFGHAVGDDTLRIVAEALAANSRQTDRAYRIGGDEFAVLMPGCATSNAIRRAEAVRCAVETSPRFDLVGRGARARRTVTVSLGVASLPDHARHHLELRHAADAAMYTAKNAGRNRVAAANVAA
jgi:diguanylate cyclase (GGDEF)-like protein